MPFAIKQAAGDPVLLLMSVGLQNVPQTLMSYADSTGATRWDILTTLRLHFALPGLAAGLQAAIPVALLGSMLGELTGARWGLGSYLLAIMAQASPPKEVGIFVVTAPEVESALCSSRPEESRTSV